MQCFQLGRSVYKTYFGDPMLAGFKMQASQTHVPSEWCVWYDEPPLSQLDKNYRRVNRLNMC